MKNTSVSGYPGPQRWFGGECSDAFADLPGFGSGTRLRSLGCRYRETICPMPSVQAISLSGSTTRSWSVYNALRCCGEGARTALRIAREGSLVERERERERKRQREWRIAWLRSVLRCRGVCFGLSETTLRTDPPWMENIGLLMKIEGILEERETKYNFVGSFKRFEESVTPRPFCTVV